eukprot:TRINITY_DN6831_c0_g1_i1.p1 TRINITY_DN6831_c0_g1~~TRINITY_DN6831_c0_g1_i1.p1  ORF type:complete len:337 (-),score=69.84 TRINITY_DN6831_c0_g1_i1:80-1006(-)
MSSSITYAGVEAGGTTFAVAIAKGDPENIVERAVFPTTVPEETIGNVVNWLKERKFDTLGIGSFGPVDLDKNSGTYGYITTTPKPNWHMTNILGPFKQFNVPIGFDTDVNGPAVSEAVLGGHRKDKGGVVQSCAYVTVGTGVGVGIFAGGAPIHGLIHPEMGHLYTARKEGDEHFKGTCPYHGACLEGMVSTGALSARSGVPAAELPHLPDDHQIWETAGFYLAHLCAALVLSVSPEVIVLGGGVMNRKILYSIVRKYTKQILNGYIRSPLITEHIDKYIVGSGFGTNAGKVGSLELGKVALKFQRKL